MAQIFISYSRVDTAFVKRLYERLQRLRPGDRVWYDDAPDGILGGHRWWDKILDEIAASDVFVYVLSNESVESKYCAAEFEEARRLQKPIVTIQVRDRTRLTDALSDIQYVDMKNGVEDAEAIARLGGALNHQLAQARRRRPLWQPRTPCPSDDKPATRGPDAPDIDTPTLEDPVRTAEPASGQNARLTPLVLVAILVLIGVMVVAYIALTTGNNNDPTVTDEPTAVAANPSATIPTDDPDPTTTAVAATPTDDPDPTINTVGTAFLPSATIPTDDPTQTPTDQPTPTATDQPSATPDVVSAAQTVAAQRTAQAILDQETASAARLTQDAALNLTESANLTATATQWTRTPTPDLTASVEAVLRQWANETATQDALNATATATLWTDTPTPTKTPTPTPDPIDLARTPVTRNNDWTSVEREFDLPGGGTVTMVLVPAGCFWMGSGEGDSDEQPVRRQCFDEPFWIDKYEVTNGQMAAFLNTNGNRSPDGFEYLDADDPDARIASNGGQWVVDAGYADHPAIEVTWFAARDYCAARGGGLPTEAEWEYAARGPDGLVYPWGDEFVAENAVGNSSSTAAVGGDERAGGRSWVGAHDLSGNVWEWVSSLYQDYPYDDNHESNSDTSNVRVLRGGSFDPSTNYLRSANRNYGSPGTSVNNGGFRCARS